MKEMTKMEIGKKYKVTKREFVKKLIQHFGHGGLSQDAFEENELTKDGELRAVRMTLYYKGDDHIATWQSGTGWLVEAEA